MGRFRPVRSAIAAAASIETARAPLVAERARLEVAALTPNSSAIVGRSGWTE